MTDLEKFLRQATRGLWGRERQTVRQELESHVRHRAQRYEISGSSEFEAIKLAIADLGEVQAINTGMKKVYIMPITIRTGILTAVLTTLCFMGVQHGIAQVTGTNVFPTPACLEQKQTTFKVGPDEIPCENGFGFNVERLFSNRMRAYPLALTGFAIDIKELQKVLVPLGVTFEKSSLKDSFTVRFPEGNTVTLSQWADERLYGSNVSIPIVKGYISIWEFWTQMRNIGLPMQIKGWDNPRITIGKTSFTLGSAAQQVQGLDVHWALLSREIDSYLRDTSDYNGNEFLYAATKQAELIPGQIVQPSNRITRTLRTNLPANSIVMVMSREWLTLKNQKPQQFRRAFFAQVNKDGSIDYTSFTKKLAVVKISQIKRSMANSTATIAIARFTGQFGFTTDSLEPADPATIKIESR
jgi:hypothetical protein